MIVDDNQFYLARFLPTLYDLVDDSRKSEVGQKLHLLTQTVD